MGEYCPKHQKASQYLHRTISAQSRQRVREPSEHRYGKVCWLPAWPDRPPTKALMQTYTYILKCSDNTLYTGWTTNLERRLATHNQGKGAKYTRTRLPVTLVYWETFDTKKEAMQREAAIKKLSRPQKERLISANPIST